MTKILMTGGAGFIGSHTCLVLLEAGPTRAALSGEGTWWSSVAVEDALAGADAVLILTEWQHCHSLDWAALAPLMRQPAWVFDARSVVDAATVAAAGLKVWRVGEGQA
jgi:UDPglucose 6-dehydrogenase